MSLRAGAHGIWLALLLCAGVAVAGEQPAAGSPAPEPTTAPARPAGSAEDETPSAEPAAEPATELAAPEPAPPPDLAELAPTGETPGDEPAGAALVSSPESPGQAGQPTGTDWQLVGGIITAGAGVAFLVVGHYALFRINDAVREDELKAYRKAVPDGQSSCASARAGNVAIVDGEPGPDPSAVADLCDEAEALEVVRNVALPVGAAATVVGLLLIGTSDTVNGPDREEADARVWRLNVGVSPQGGAASITFSW